MVQRPLFIKVSCGKFLDSAKCLHCFIYICWLETMGSSDIFLKWGGFHIYGQTTLKSFPSRSCKVVINRDVCGGCLAIVVRILVGVSPLDTLHQFSAQLNMIFLLRWNSVLITSVIIYCGESYLLTSCGNIGYIRLQGPRVGFLDISIVLSIFAG